MDLEKHPQQPPPPVGIRASDADRDRIADILRDALAEGRLDSDEHAERIESVYRAKTLAELEPLVQDLPAAGARREPAAGVYAPAADDPDTPVTAENLVAIFSSSTRKGRWRIGRRTNAFSLFGSVEIDLTEALFEQRLTVINATAIFGSVDIRVPENITPAAAAPESSVRSGWSRWSRRIRRRRSSWSTEARCSAASRPGRSAGS